MTALNTESTASAVTVINTSEPAIYISMEFGEDDDLYGGPNVWKWTAKRSWTTGGATRTEIVEVPHDAEGADEENVDSMIRYLTRAPEGSVAKYAVSRADDAPTYVAVRIA